jgi:hypothetical protein
LLEHGRLATQPGGAEKVKKATTASGIRDTTTAAILNYVLELGKQLRKREGGQRAVPEAEIQERLKQELEDRLFQQTINPLLGMQGVDIHRDTPTEVLHTILLGVVKYFWAQTVWLLEKSKTLETFQMRLGTIDCEGLNIPPINSEYICRYKGSLIGKHFKSLAQVMPILIFDLVPSTVLEAWTIIGTLVVLVWHTTIKDTERYLVCLP